MAVTPRLLSGKLRLQLIVDEVTWEISFGTSGHPAISSEDPIDLNGDTNTSLVTLYQLLYGRQ